MGRVLVIGLDGATFDLIDPWVEEGKLPVLAHCIQKGTRSILRSTPLSNSAQAWSSFATGKNPGKHGIFDFFESLPDSYGVRFINASFRRGRSLWRLVSDAGKRVGVMNVPITYPPEPVNGFLIPGLDAPGMASDFAHPRGLMEEIHREVGGYILEAGIWGYIRRGRPDIALQKLLDMVRLRTATAKYLMRSRPWDLFVVVYTATDKVQHHFWKYIDPTRPEFHLTEPFSNAILQVYQEVDRAIGELMDQAEGATTMILSDHGAGPSSRRTMYINRWLNREGYLHVARGGGVSSRLGELGYRVLERANNEIKRWLPRGAKEMLLRHLTGLRDRVDSVLSLPGIRWSRTVAYSRENHPAIFINTVGREAEGIVEPGEPYERIRNELIESLERLRCPETGERIVGRIFKRDEVYEGSETFKAPDVIFEWYRHGYVHRPSGMGLNGHFVEALNDKELLSSEKTIRPSGIHRDEGIFIGCGSPVGEGRMTESATLYDIAPTILYLLGVPIPDDMDGRVLRDAMDEAFVRENPLKTVAIPASEDGLPEEFGWREAKAIERKLRGLGYID